MNRYGFTLAVSFLKFLQRLYSAHKMKTPDLTRIPVFTDKAFSMD